MATEGTTTATVPEHVTTPDPADALTADGAIVAIRPVTVADRDAVTALFHRSSDEALRRRFFTTPGLAAVAAEVERLTAPPSADRLTLAAVLGDEIIGVASYDRESPGADRAEFAVLVDDAHQGRGVGTLLLEHLSQYARACGVAALTGEVLADNQRMLRMAGDLPATTTGADASVRDVTVATEADEAAQRRIAERERAAGRASVRPLLAPRSVAVVGAGRSGGVGHEVLKGLIGYDFAGPVYPVNPHATAVAGVPAYTSLSQLPGPAELVVVAVPAPHVADTLTEAAAAGARAAVVLTSGFAEEGGDGPAAQAALVRAARRHGIRLVGPNCLGVVNTDPQVRLDASFAPAPPAAGGLAVASQSGAVGIAVLDQLSRSGYGVSSFVSLGNKADVSGNDLIAYWYDDPGTRAVALYLESFGNPRKFARVARALARRKPVLAVVSGRSAAGARAGASHTAAAAAPDTTVDSLFAQAGVVRVDHLGELVDTARMLTDQPLPAGDRLAVLGNAGGVNVLVADAAEAAGLELPPDIAGLPNPYDLGAGTTPEALQEALAAVAHAQAVDTVVVVVAATRTNDPAASWEAVAQVADAHPDLPVAGVALGGDPPAALGDRRVPVYDLPERAAHAIGRAARYAAWRREPLGTPPELSGVDRAGAREMVRDALAHGEGWQPYERIAALLGAYDVPVLTSATVTSADDAAAAADRLGFPVVLKAADPQLVHKSDIGAVRLGLADAEQVRTAYREIATALAQPDAPVLVQPMARGDVELVAGITHDPLFGSLVMLGLGGVHTDVLGDRAFRLVPLTDRDAARMWRGLRSAPLLTGYRDLPAVDTGAVEDLVLRLGALAEDLPEVAELDLNPVLVSPHGAIAVDAALRLAPAGPEPDPVLRRLR